jgi:ATP-dependent helicase/nuclease subunit A
VTVRDKGTGLARPARPGDIGILFRSRSTHREFERELNARSVPTHVYKGLGFFDADEIKDVLALLWYLADPLSDLRAAALLRSRFFRVSDEALRLLAPDIAAALAGPDPALRQAQGAPRLSRGGSRIPARLSRLPASPPRRSAT